MDVDLPAPQTPAAHKPANGSMIWYFSHKWWCHWSELVLSLAEYLQFSGTMIVSGFCRQSSQSRSTQMPLLRTLVFNNHLSKPDTKERLENHFKIFPHRSEETFGRFSKKMPCEVSKKKMMYGCLMCHRTFKSSRKCYHCCYKTPISYGPYFTTQVITCGRI